MRRYGDTLGTITFLVREGGLEGVVDDSICVASRHGLFLRISGFQYQVG
jgi:hypothetical protein